MLPRKKAGLLSEMLGEETMVYDPTRHRAHCLNHSAKLVWSRCNGKTTVAELAAAVQSALGAPFGEDEVRDALTKLRKAHLLEPDAEPSVEVVRQGRRAMARRLATAGVAALVTSIVVPTPAMAASGAAPGACCTGGGPECASKQCVSCGAPGNPCISAICCAPGGTSKCCV